MATLAQLVVKLQADTAELVAGFSKAEQSATKFGDHVKGKLSGLGSALGDVAKIASGFVIGRGIMEIPGFLTSAAQDAADEAAAIARLQQAVENTGASWGEYAGKMEDVVGQGIKLGFTDDDTRSALALLTAQTSDAGEAMRRFSLAQDLSRGANIDLVTASKLLGKVTDENVNVLARYGIKAREGMGETELFGMIQEKFGGQAAAFGRSTAGQMARAKAEMQELKESIGYMVMPALTAVASFLNSSVIPALNKVADLVGPAISKAVAAAGDFMSKLGGRFDIGGAFSDAADAISDFGRAALPVVRDIGGQLLGIFQAIAREVGPSFIAFWKQVGDSIMEIAPSVGAFARTIGEVIASFLEWAKSSGLLHAALVGLKTMWDGMKAVLDLLTPVIKTVIDFFAEHKAATALLVAALGALLIALFPIPAAIIAITVAVGYLREHWDAIKAKTEEIWNAIPGPIKAALTIIVDIFRFQFETARDIVVATFDLIRDYIELAINVIRDIVVIGMAILQGDWGAAWDGIKQLAADVFDGIRTLVTDQLELINAIFGGFPGRILGKLGDWANAGLQLGQAVASGIVEAIKAVLGGAVDIADALIAAVKAAWNAMIDWADAHFRISIPVPFAPDITFDPDLSFAKLARGGIVTRPTLALLGEAGPEAVVPLGRGNSSAQSGVVSYTVYNPTFVYQGSAREALEAMGAAL